MYNVDVYSDKELMDILDVFNPTDRELEMKIIHFIRKYDSFQNEEGERLATFFRNIYRRFFYVVDSDSDSESGSCSGLEKEKGEMGEKEENRIEGFVATNNYVIGGGKPGKTIMTNRRSEISGFSNEKEVLPAVDGDNASVQVVGPRISDATNPTLNQVGYDVQLTTNLDYAKGKLNPLLKETVKRIISIDSQYRDSPKSLSTDFTMNFNEILRDVVSLKLYAVQIPYNWYTISQNYGSNFLYIKGISPGINDGNHDFKITIDPGNYDQTSLTSAIQTSIKGLPLLYPDISFGSTQLIYNTTACLATYNIDIQNVFNESSYAFYFDGPLHYPKQNIDRSRYLGAFLGFNYDQYSLSAAYSSRKIISDTGRLENSNSKYIFNSSNSVINVIQYAGPGEFVSSSSSTIIQTLNISFPITGVGLTQQGVFDTVNRVLSEDTRFVNASVVFKQITGTDVCGNTIDSSGNYRFEWNLKLNRRLGNNIPGSKICLILPQENIILGNSPIWIGSTSCFSFDQSYNEINTLVSESVVSSSDFKIIGNVYYAFVLGNANYNVNGVNDLSYALTNSFSGYSLTNYLVEINRGITTMNSVHLRDNSYNLFIPGYNSFYINNNDAKVHVDVNMSRYFFTENYVIDISGTLMNTLFGISKTDLNVGVDLSFGVIKTGSFANQSEYTVNDGNTLLMKVYANPKNRNGVNPNPADLSYNIYMPSGRYSIAQLKAVVENVFKNYSEPSLPSSKPFANMSLSIKDDVNPYISNLTIGIEKVILEDEYHLRFYDVSYNTWSRYLYLNPSYLLGNYTRDQYSDISGSNTIINDTISLDASGATFHLMPLDVSSGDISFFVPSGTYTRSQLFNTMNNLFASNPITSGTTITAITVGEVDYTKIRWNINKVYTSSDYQLVFYDLFSFVSCYLGSSSVRNATWDTTLGWITGFRSLTQYLLTASNVYTDINSGNTYYVNTKSPYTVNTSIPNRCIVRITGDTTVSVNLYNYFMVVLDDYNQNHLNDGLITITPKDNNLELPSYANRYSSICDPSTGQILNVGITNPASNKLTQNQVYSLNQIIQTQNTAKGYTNSGVFVKDIFGLIPIKTSGMMPGSTYVEFGGTLQNQDRIYFGPVNIHRMAIKLVNDRGDIVDLNGANWSLQFVCEQLYQTSFSNNVNPSNKKG
jgi:hypothetical protein